MSEEQKPLIKSEKLPSDAPTVAPKPDYQTLNEIKEDGDDVKTSGQITSYIHTNTLKRLRWYREEIDNNREQLGNEFLTALTDAYIDQLPSNKKNNPVKEEWREALSSSHAEVRVDYPYGGQVGKNFWENRTDKGAFKQFIANIEDEDFLKILVSTKRLSHQLESDPITYSDKTWCWSPTEVSILAGVSTEIRGVTFFSDGARRQKDAKEHPTENLPKGNLIYCNGLLLGSPIVNKAVDAETIENWDEKQGSKVKEKKEVEPDSLPSREKDPRVIQGFNSDQTENFKKVNEDFYYQKLFIERLLPVLQGKRGVVTLPGIGTGAFADLGGIPPKLAKDILNEGLQRFIKEEGHKFPEIQAFICEFFDYPKPSSSDQKESAIQKPTVSACERSGGGSVNVIMSPSAYTGLNVFQPPSAYNEYLTNFNGDLNKAEWHVIIPWDPCSFIGNEYFKGPSSWQGSNDPPSVINTNALSKLTGIEGDYQADLDKDGKETKVKTKSYQPRGYSSWTAAIATQGIKHPAGKILCVDPQNAQLKALDAVTVDLTQDDRLAFSSYSRGCKPFDKSEKPKWRYFNLKNLGLFGKGSALTLGGITIAALPTATGLSIAANMYPDAEGIIKFKELTGIFAQNFLFKNAGSANVGIATGITLDSLLVLFVVAYLIHRSRVKANNEFMPTEVEMIQTGNPAEI